MESASFGKLSFCRLGGGHPPDNPRQVLRLLRRRPTNQTRLPGLPKRPDQMDAVAEYRENSSLFNSCVTAGEAIKKRLRQLTPSGKIETFHWNLLTEMIKPI